VKTYLASYMRICSPNFSSKLVFRDPEWLHKITATHINLDIAVTGGQQDLGKSPYSVAPLLQHGICGTDM